VRRRVDRGSVTVELVVLAPVLVVLALFVLYAGRSGEALLQLRHAADQGARAASMVAPERMVGVGRSAALADLARNGVSCVNAVVNVAVDDDSPVHSVLVEVECEVRRRGLDLLGASRRVLYASSIEVIDLWRVR
jgi:hypothetical protein